MSGPRCEASRHLNHAAADPGYPACFSVFFFTWLKTRFFCFFSGGKRFAIPGILWHNESKSRGAKIVPIGIPQIRHLRLFFVAASGPRVYRRVCLCVVCLLSRESCAISVPFYRVKMGKNRVFLGIVPIKKESPKQSQVTESG